MERKVSIEKVKSLQFRLNLAEGKIKALSKGMTFWIVLSFVFLAIMVAVAVGLFLFLRKSSTLLAPFIAAKKVETTRVEYL